MKKECRDFYRQIQHTYNDIAVREDAVLSSILLSASNGLIKTSDVPRVAYELTQQLALLLMLIQQITIVKILKLKFIQIMPEMI